MNLHALPKSFYSSNFYRDVYQNWTFGRSFLTLALVLVLAWIGLTIKTSVAANNYLKTQLPLFLDQIPTIQIANGEILVDAEQPYFITTPDSQNPLIIIDTTGEITSLSNYPDTEVLITKTTFIRRRGAQDEVRPVSPEINMVITKEKIASWAYQFRWIFPIGFFLITLFGSLLFRLMQTLLYSLFGLLIAKMTERHITYEKIFILGLVSIIPAIFFRWILWITGLQFPLSLLVGFLIGMGYLAFAITSAVPKEPN